MRKTLRAAGAAALTTGLVLLGASSASAHVSVIPDTTAAGAYALLTFGVPHGCEGSPTTRVSIQIPEQIAAVTPTVNPGWDVEKVMADLAEPIDDGHGGQRTERVAEIVYTAATPLPDGYRDAFVLSLKLPDAAGEPLVFPTIQECEEGESAWVQLPGNGEDPDTLDLPAPMFEVTPAAAASAEEDSADTMSNASEEVAAAATTDGAPAPAGDGAAAAPAPDGDGDGDGDGDAQAAASTDASMPAVTWVALALGACGLALGSLALVRARRTQS